MDGLTRGSAVRAAGLALAGALAVAACAPRSRAQSSAADVARTIIPRVERAVGLTFRRPPDIEVRSREQLRAYLTHKMAEELPPAELAAVERTYRAFGLVPDSLDLHRLMLDLYDEQVAGYYDPDSAALFVVRGADSLALRLIMAHELVHALQDEYTPLNAILKLKRQNDRQMAGQAVAEGQATLASVEALAPGTDVGRVLGDWDTMRDLVRSQKAAMPVFASAPLIVQEGLLFPYVAGAQFMSVFDTTRAAPGDEPYGDKMPVSTSQVLHPALYWAHHLPLVVRFGPVPAGDTLVYEDDLGEFETRIALETWRTDESVAIAAAMGWDGDRYELLGTPSGSALVWVAAWMTPADADRFARTLVTGWGRRTGAAGAPAGATGAAYGAPPARRRWAVDRLLLAGEQAVRLVDAPAAWPGWRSLPGAEASRMRR
jgi:hypothetical protein